MGKTVKQITDITLHIVGGFAIAAVLGADEWWKCAITASIYGLLREQAQHYNQGWVGAFYDALHGVRWLRITEGLVWGVGAGLGGLINA